MGILSTIKKDVELVKPIDTIPDQNDPALTAYDTQMEAALAEEQKHASQASKELENLKNDTMASIDSDQEKQEELVQSGLELQEQKLNNEIAKSEKSMRAEKADAYADYQKEIDPYGINAEYRASQGLNRSGYSESAKVAAFTAYQHRVATARAAFEQAKTEYNIAMEEAKQNANVELANISAKSLQQKLTATMQFFTMNDSIYNNSLANRISIQNHYNTQKNNEWEKINKKLAAEEEARRWNQEYRDNKVTRDLQNQLLQKEIDAYDQQSGVVIEKDDTPPSDEETLPAGVKSINEDGSVTLEDDLWKNPDKIWSYDGDASNPDMPIDTSSLKNTKFAHLTPSQLYALTKQDPPLLLEYELNGVRRFCEPDSEEGKKLLAYRESKNKGITLGAENSANANAYNALFPNSVAGIPKSAPSQTVFTSEQKQQNQATSQVAAKQSSSGQDSSKPWDEMTQEEKDARMEYWKQTGYKQTKFSSEDEEMWFLWSMPATARSEKQANRLRELMIKWYNG